MTEQESDSQASELFDAGVGHPVGGEESVASGRTDRRDEPERRRSALDRRTGLDRRRRDVPVKVDRRKDLDRRRGPGIRRDENRRAAEEGEMTDEQFEFVMAVDRYKRANKRPFPTLTEILEIIKALGYMKID